MTLPIITQVKQTSSSEVSFSWSDGFTAVVTLRDIRAACPCAGCKGETVLLKTYSPPEPSSESPGMYDLKAIETVGGYALKFTWGDGHNMGIYTWEHLRNMMKQTDKK